MWVPLETYTKKEHLYCMSLLNNMLNVFVFAFTVFTSLFNVTLKEKSYSFCSTKNWKHV